MLAERGIFNNWRGEDALAEQDFFAVIEQISDYLKTLDNLGQLKTEFADDPNLTKYRKFKEPLGNSLFKLGLVGVAYARVTVGLMLESWPQNKKILKDIANSLEKIYSSPYSTNGPEIENLFDLLKTAIQEYPPQEDTKEIFSRIYFVLLLAKIALKKVPDKAQFILKLNKINLKSIRPQLDGLLIQIRVIEYVEAFHSVEQLKGDFVTEKWKKLFNDFVDEPDNSEKRKVAVLAVCELLSAKYPKDSQGKQPKSSEEKKLIEQFILCLKKNEDDETKTQEIDMWLEGAKTLLNQYPNPKMNGKEVRRFLNHLYFTLVFIKGIVPEEPLVPLNNNQLTQLDALLLLIGEKDEAIKLAAQQNENEVQYEEIEPYFQHRFAKVIENSNPIPVKVNALIGEMDKVERELKSLKQLYFLQESLVEQQKAIMQLSKALHDNDKKLKDREYALDLVTQYSTELKTLITVLKKYNVNPKLINDYESTLELLEDDSVEQVVKSAALSSISQSMQWLTSFYRAHAPTKVQEFIERNAPTTLDSECKRQLKQMVFEGLNKMDKELDKINGKIKDAAKKLTEDKAKLISKKTVAELEVLITANQEIKTLANEYLQIFNYALGIRKEIARLEVIDQTIEEYIKTHDDFWVALSNFFAKILAIFKSEKAKIIDQSRELRAELAVQISSYKKEVEDTLNKLPQQPQLDELNAGLESDLYCPPPEPKVLRTSDMRELIKNKQLLFKPAPIIDTDAPQTAPVAAV